MRKTSAWARYEDHTGSGATSADGMIGHWVCALVGRSVEVTALCMGTTQHHIQPVCTLQSRL